MKLSELINYLNHIEQFDLDAMQQQSRFEIDKLIHYIINDPVVRFPDLSAACQSSSQAIDRGYENFALKILDLKRHITNLVNEQHDRYLKASLDHFHNETPHETDEYILNRRLTLTDEDKKLLVGRILRYSKWQSAGIIVRPGKEDWIELSVALDPLYLLDRNKELLQPTTARFHEVYQKRLRLYSISEQIGRPILDQLPDQQFGYCFIFNYFNYRPLELIYQYLEELWKKLRPGGVVFFTFNDCDDAHSIALSESNFMCYTPGKSLVSHAQSLGYEIVDRYRGDLDLAWLELAKPGKFRSLKGGQNLAKILARSK